MFDAADRQFQNGYFDNLLRAVIPNQVDVVRVPDSPTSTMVRAVCDTGYQFNDTLLLCGKYRLSDIEPFSTCFSCCLERLKHPDNVDGPLAFVRFYRL
jgi:hypothetical protein